MTPPDNKDLTEDDYLEADFTSDLDQDFDQDIESELDADIDGDQDFDDAEELFPQKKEKKKRGAFIAGLVMVTALAAGAGFYFLGRDNAAPLPIQHAAVPSPSADETNIAGVTDIPTPPAGSSSDPLPVLPTPASDFEMDSDPSTPLAALPEVPADTTINETPPDAGVTDANALPEVPVGNQPALDVSADGAGELPQIPGAEAPQQQPAPTDAVIEISNEPGQTITDMPAAQQVTDGSSISQSSKATTSSGAAISPPKSSIREDASGETSVSGLPIPENADQAKSGPAPAARPANARNVQNDYFDSPEGRSVRELPPPSINPFTQPGQNLIIVHRNPVAGAVLEKSDNNAFVESKLISANRASALGKNEAALEFYNELYRENSRDPRILMGRAVTLQKLGETQKAVDAYNEVLDVQPDNPEAVTNLMGLIGGTKPAVALENLLTLRQALPRNPAVAAQLGVAYAQSGNPQDGLKYLKIASDLEPDNAQHYFNMAVINEHLNDRARAIKNYEQALDMSAIHGLKNSSSFTREDIYDRLSRLRGY